MDIAEKMNGSPEQKFTSPHLYTWICGLGTSGPLPSVVDCVGLKHVATTTVIGQPAEGERDTAPGKVEAIRGEEVVGSQGGHDEDDLN